MARVHLTNRWSQSLAGAMTSLQHVYEVRPRKDKRGIDLISDALPFGENNSVKNYGKIPSISR
jgi:hypothetical protein